MAFHPGEATDLRKWDSDGHTPRQALVARFLGLAFVAVDLLTRAMRLAPGVLCGRVGTSDVVDAAVVVSARERGARYVVRRDAADLRKLDATLLLREP